MDIWQVCAQRLATRFPESPRVALLHGMILEGKGDLVVAQRFYEARLGKDQTDVVSFSSGSSHDYGISAVNEETDGMTMKEYTKATYNSTSYFAARFLVRIYFSLDLILSRSNDQIKVESGSYRQPSLDWTYIAQSRKRIGAVGGILRYFLFGYRCLGNVGGCVCGIRTVRCPFRLMKAMSLGRLNWYLLLQKIRPITLSSLSSHPPLAAQSYISPTSRRNKLHAGRLRASVQGDDESCRDERWWVDGERRSRVEGLYGS